jgi:undecaprenyl-diphosphatase
MLTTSTRDKKYYIKLALWAFAIVAVGLVIWALDWKILYAIQGIRNGFFDFIVPLYTTLGEWAIMWIVIGLVMMIFKKYRKCGFFVLVSLLLGLLICNIALKNIIARDRPCYLVPLEFWESIKLVGDPSEFSFPSGHSVSSMAAAFTIFLHHKKLGKVAVALAILMGLSRLYVFVHFPTDVYGGLLIGAAIAYAVYYIQNKITEKRNKSTETK